MRALGKGDGLQVLQTLNLPGIYIHFLKKNAVKGDVPAGPVERALQPLQLPLHPLLGIHTFFGVVPEGHTL
jgi:hypothetical protein